MSVGAVVCLVNMKPLSFKSLDLFTKVDAQGTVTRSSGGAGLWLSLFKTIILLFQFNSVFSFIVSSFMLSSLSCSVWLRTVFIVCLLIAAVLIFREIQMYREVRWVSTVTVDTRPIPEQHHIELGLDISLPGMECSGMWLCLLCRMHVLY